MMYGVSATSILYFLFSKHEDASSQYKQMGERLDDQTLSAYMHELEQFHSGQSNGIRKLLNDMSPSPMPMPDNEQKKSLLSREQSAVWDAIAQKEYQQVLDFVNQNEHAISATYKEGLHIDGLPEGIREMLKELHQREMKAVLQTERYKTVQDIQLGNIPTG